MAKTPALCVFREREAKLEGLEWKAVNAFRKAIGVRNDAIEKISKVRIYYDTSDFKLDDRGLEVRSYFKEKRGLYKHQIKVPVAAAQDGILDRVEVSWHSSSPNPDFENLSMRDIANIDNAQVRETVKWAKENLSSETLKPICAVYTYRRNFIQSDGDDAFEYSYSDGFALSADGVISPIQSFEVEQKSGKDGGLTHAFADARDHLSVGRTTNSSVAAPAITATRRFAETEGYMPEANFLKLTPRHWAKRTLAAIAGLLKPKHMPETVTFKP